MTPRTRLRAETRIEHASVDKLYSRFDLSSPEGYRALLAAQAAAFLPIEDALDAAGAGRLLEDWPRRRRADQLSADLAELGVPCPAPLVPPHFATDFELLGGLYVLEGSRLGGSILSSRVPPGAPSRFLRAEGGAGAWRSLLALLDVCLDRPLALDAAVAAARATFRCFERSARFVMEPVLA